MEYFITSLTQGRHAREIQVATTDQIYVDDWQLLTLKPVIYFVNVDEDTLMGKKNIHLTTLQTEVAKENAQLIMGCATLEAQMNMLSDDEKKFFLQAYNVTASGLDTLIQTAYTLLRLITYFTVGPKEVRAWTIEQGTKAPQAAGVIHTDFQRGFIKAEVISFQDYQTFTSEGACREAGKLRIEGKDYIVQDGDIILFRFNV